MNDSCPLTSGPCFDAVRKMLAVTVCALFAQPNAGASPFADERSSEMPRNRLGKPVVTRTVVAHTNRPARSRTHGESSWIDWSRPVRQIEQPSHSISEPKLLGLSLIDEVSRLLSLLPLWQTVGEGEPLTLSIGVNAIELVSLQWYFNGQPIPGADRGALTIASVTSAEVGRYELRANVLGTRLTSEPTDVQINATDGAVDRSVAAFDRFVNAAQLIQRASAKSSSAKSATARGFSGTQIFGTIGATKETGEPNHCGIAGGASEWFAWQLPTNGTVVITTDGSNFDTVLAVYVGPGDSFASLTSVACDNDGGANGKTSRTTFTGTTGTIYYIAVDGVNGAKGTVKLNYAVGATPIILSEPSSRTVAFGKTATLAVNAFASPPARYQWTFNGVKITNATNASLTLTGITPNNLGGYRVCVTNAIGATWSLRADLLPEQPLHFSSRRMAENGFHFSVYGPAGTNYAVDSSRDVITWIPVTTNRTQTGLFDFIDHSATSNGSGFYRIRSAP